MQNILLIGLLVYFFAVFANGTFYLGLNGLLFPVQNMVNEGVLYLPNIFIAGVIVFVGYILA